MVRPVDGNRAASNAPASQNNTLKNNADQVAKAAKPAIAHTQPSASKKLTTANITTPDAALSKKMASAAYRGLPHGTKK